MNPKIIDISHYQNVKDLNAIQRDGLAAIICKATDGLNFTDPTFAYRMNNIPKLGLIPGAYHFGRRLQDPVKQCQKFAQTIKAWCPLIPALDLERSTDGTGIAEDWAQESIAENIAWVMAWLHEFGNHFKGLPVIYSTKNFMDTYLKGLDLSAWPSWVADYNPGITEPVLLPYFKTWTIWQKSEGDQEAGIVGSDDLDEFNGTVDQLKALTCVEV
jgi:lysozyme